jgi:hypothetical protein
MEYLIKKNRQKHIRMVWVGYFLCGIMLVLATILANALISGYYLDKNGDLIQNGLVVLNTEPKSATIAINGQDQDKSTPEKVVIPEGEYRFVLSKAGYYDFEKNFKLSGSEVKNLKNIRLLPLSVKYLAAPQPLVPTPTIIPEVPTKVQNQSVEIKDKNIVSGTLPGQILVKTKDTDTLLTTHDYSGLVSGKLDLFLSSNKRLVAVSVSSAQVIDFGKNNNLADTEQNPDNKRLINIQNGGTVITNAFSPKGSYFVSCTATDCVTIDTLYRNVYRHVMPSGYNRVVFIGEGLILFTRDNDLKSGIVSDYEGENINPLVVTGLPIFASVDKLTWSENDQKLSVEIIFVDGRRETGSLGFSKDSLDIL